MTIDEKIDTLMDDINELEKRKPKPFRYIDDVNNLENELNINKEVKHTIMKNEIENNTRNNEDPVLLGNDKNTMIVEDIIMKHKEKIKNIEH